METYGFMASSPIWASFGWAVKLDVVDLPETALGRSLTQSWPIAISTEPECDKGKWVSTVCFADTVYELTCLFLSCYPARYLAWMWQHVSWKETYQAEIGMCKYNRITRSSPQLQDRLGKIVCHSHRLCWLCCLLEPSPDQLISSPFEQESSMTLQRVQRYSRKPLISSPSNHLKVLKRIACTWSMKHWKGRYSMSANDVVRTVRRWEEF